MEYVDLLTWPVISILIKRISEMPPTDIMVFGFMKGMQKKQADVPQVPFKKVKRGTLKRRK